MGTAREQIVHRGFEGPGREPQQHFARFVVVVHAEVGVEFEEQRVEDLVIEFRDVEHALAEVDRLFEIGEWMHAQLGCVQHRLDVAIIERDRLLVGLDGLIGVAFERGYVTEQVEGFRRVWGELKCAACR